MATQVYRITLLTFMAMLAFAANSVLCRMALMQTTIDAAGFTTIRLLSGALMLWVIVCLRGGARGEIPAQARAEAGSWLSALALFAYAAGFSFAYVSLPTATGALLLFGAVQVTMIGQGVRAGERLQARQVTGLLLAFGGLIGLLLPGVAAPPPWAALLMLGAGVSWGIYSLRGRCAVDPLRTTTGNFLRTLPILLVLVMFLSRDIRVDLAGVGYAIASGALASGIGYAIWYAALPSLKATTAATVQLGVPVLAAIGGALFLAEPLTMRLVLAAMAVLGGIALVILRPAQREKYRKA